MAVKNALMLIALFLGAIFFSKFAAMSGAQEPKGITFALRAQRVVGCSDKGVILQEVVNARTTTYLNKDATWPHCAEMSGGEVNDYFLARGEKTKYISSEPTAWWRKAL